MSGYLTRYAPYWDVSRIRYVGAKRAEELHKHGINTVLDLCYYFPKEYIPNEVYPVTPENCDSKKSYILTLTSAASVFRSKGVNKVLRVVARDQNKTKVTILYFNQPYLKNEFVRGRTHLFYGEMKYKNGEFLLVAPEKDYKLDAYCKFTPIYKPIGSIPGKTVRKMIHTVLFACAEEIEEKLDYRYIRKYNIPLLNRAIVAIHYPVSEEDLLISRKRFAIEKLIEFSRSLAKYESDNKSKQIYGIRAFSLLPFEKRLPFELTLSQKKVISEISKLMISNTKIEAINRLIQGDVGSGKTVVIAALAYLLAKNMKSTVIMVPTEILADQHYKTFSKFFSPFQTKIMLLTSATPKNEAKSIEEFVKTTEEPYILIGTHSLISDTREYKNVYLTVTDEQHRFGTIQRSLLNEKCENCHSVVMSATPIPRSLAMFLNTENSISVIDSLPEGRKPTKTVYVGEDKMERIYKFIRDKAKTGQRTYFVCPMIEPNEELIGIISAKTQFEECQNAFPDLNVGFLNGKMSNQEKNETMSKFANGEISVLVSTTVIEVGVDVPEATTIVIMNAERLGLSQLHQLRGRVGRGKDAGTCILVSSSSSKKARARLNFMCKNSDGFKIAEYDLKTRGPGDFFGTEQSGFYALPFSDILDEETIAEVIREEKLNFSPNVEKTYPVIHEAFKKN